MSIRQIYTRAQVYASLKRFWGYDELREGQAEAVRAVLAGRDSLLVMPTGGGKSLCFQLPAVVMDKLCIVISPLIALMKDQVDGLCVNGYPAASLHSGDDAAEFSDVISDCQEGRIRLLYISPKRAVQPAFQRRLAAIGVAAVFVDEAHCISQWGHDFIPEYRRLSELADAFPGASLHAYTATATPRVQTDICEELRLRNPIVHIGSFDRPNLYYKVLPRARHEPDGPLKSGTRKLAAKAPRATAAAQASHLPMAKQVAGLIREAEPGGTIVYCIRRADTQTLADALCGLGIEAKPYHAGLGYETRHSVQRAFLTEQLNVVVATVAFGMGIDRGDVRRVIHANLPKSIEAYQQETGRAGRDGLPSSCYLLYDGEDADSWRYLMKQSTSAIESRELRQSVQFQHERLLNRMIDFATATTTSASPCRHRMLCEYFGQEYRPAFCGACELCHARIKAGPHEHIGRAVLRGVVGCAQHATVTNVIDHLLGVASIAALALGLHRLATWGLLGAFTLDEVRAVLNELAGAALLTANTDDLLSCTQEGAVFLESDAPLRLACLSPAFIPKPLPKHRDSFGQRATELDKLTKIEKRLRARLKEVRSRLASRRGVPPFALFDDNTLLALVRQAPTTLAGLATVPGLSAGNIKEIGETLVDAVRFAQEELIDDSL